MPAPTTSRGATAFNGGTITERLTIAQAAEGDEALRIVSAFEAADFDSVVRVLNSEASVLLAIDSEGRIEAKIWADNSPAFLVSSNVAQSAGSWLIQGLNDTATREGGVLRGGELSMLGVTSAPADGELAAGQVALWLDATNGAAKLMVKAKQADGTVRVGALALA